MHGELPPELAALEQSLAGLVPTAAAINRDRLLFLAGEASVQRRHTAWYWPTATAAALAACLTMMAVALANRPGRPAEQVVASAPVDEALVHGDAALDSARQYLALRKRMLESGDALAALPPAADRSRQPDDWPRARDAWSAIDRIGVSN